MNALSTGYHLEGKAVKPHPAPPLSSALLGCTGCSCWIGPPSLQHLCEAIPSQRTILLEMLRATKQAAEARPTIRGASLPSGKLWVITTTQAGLVQAKPLLCSGRIYAPTFKVVQPRMPFSQPLPNLGDTPVPSLHQSQWSTWTTHQQHKASERLLTSPGWAWLLLPCHSRCKTAFSKAGALSRDFQFIELIWLQLGRPDSIYNLLKLIFF